MRQPLLTLRGYLDVLLVDGTARTARRPGRVSASALGALPVAVLLLAAAIGLRATEDAGPARDAALTAPAAGGVAANAVEVRPIQVEIGRIEYLPGETASGSAPGSTDASASTSERAASPVYTFPEVYGDDEAPGLATAPGIRRAAVAASGAAPSAARVLPGQVEIGRREYLPGEGPAAATAARDGAGKREYLPGEAPAGVGDVMVPLIGRQP